MYEEEFLQNAIHQSVNKQVENLDEFLLGFFGSVGEAMRQRDNYVLEVEHLGFSTIQNVGNDVVLRSETRYRIRKKTAEEKLAEQG